MASVRAKVHLKRVYEEPSKDDGARVLVERLWPRGLRKDQAAVGLWLKEIAPSTALRQWFGHDPDKWPEFRQRYRAELEENEAPVAALEEKIQEGVVTLVFAAKDTRHNSAVVLEEYLEERAARP